MICTGVCLLFGFDSLAQTNDDKADRLRLFNGVEYISHPLTIQGQAYLNSQYVLGSIQYQGMTYTNVPLKYDMVRDELVTVYTDGNAELKFISEFVSNFSIDGHNFLYLNADDLNTAKLSPGFYEVILADQIGLYARRKRAIKEYISTQTIVTRFVEEDEFFVKMNDSFYKVSSRGDLLKLFKDKKKELANFINDGDINFRTDFALALQKTIIAYNSLKK